jgi:hypothetical protein
MNVKEAIDTLLPGTRYQLVGAMTGKTLLQSWISKKTEPFEELSVGSISASVRFHKNFAYKLPEWLEPIVVISISGK